jgi:hypothetical protein
MVHNPANAYTRSGDLLNEMEPVGVGQHTRRLECQDAQIALRGPVRKLQRAFGRGSPELDSHRKAEFPPDNQNHADLRFRHARLDGDEGASWGRWDMVRDFYVGLVASTAREFATSYLRLE